MTRALCAVSAASIAVLAGRAAAQPYSFIGPDQGDWFTATHWAPNGVPGVNPPGADVVIGPGKHAYLGSNQPPPTVGTITAGGKLTINQGITISGQATLTDGDIRGTGTAAVVCSPLNLNGQNSVWRSGRIIGRVEQNGLLTIGGTGGTSGTPALEALFRNHGGVNQGARVFLYNGSVIENTGAWEHGNGIDDSPGGNGLGGTFKNLPGGTFSRTGDAQRDISVKFESSGHIKVDQGTINCFGLHTKIGGTVELLNGGRIRINQSPLAGYEVSLAGELTGRGDVILGPIGLCTSAGITSDLSPLSTLGLNIAQGSAGVLRLDGGFDNDGLCTWHSGRIVGPGLLRNRSGGTLIWGIGAGTGAILATNLFNDDYVYVQGSPRIENAVFSNNAGGTVELVRGSLALAAASSGSFLNRGLLLKTAGPFGNTLFAVPLQMLDGGRIEVEDLGIYLMSGSEWSGSTVVELGPAAGAGLYFDPGIHTVTGGTHRYSGTGTVDVRSGSMFQVAGGEVVNEMQATASEFRVTGDVSAFGSGRFVNRAHLRVTGAISGSHTPGVDLLHNEALMTLHSGNLTGGLYNTGTLTIRGTSDLGRNGLHLPGSVRNQATMIFDGSCSLALQTEDSEVLNFGLIRKIGAASQGTVFGQGILRNYGTVTVSEGTLNIACPIGNLENGELTGGTWIAMPGTQLLLQGTINSVGPGARVQGNSVSCPWLRPVDVDGGSLLFNGLHTHLGDMFIMGGGSVQIDPGVDVNIPGGTQNGDEESILDEIVEVTVIGDVPEPRLITPTLTNHARLVPGGHGKPGPFNLTGNLVMRPTGRIMVELGGLLPVEEHDRVAIIGSAALLGTLDLSLIDGFVPAAGQEFTVLTATEGLTGAFAALAQPPGMPQGLAFDMVQTPGAVLLRVVAAGCYANCDGSVVPPALNVNDFICFQQKFAAADPYANCDGSTTPPILNVNDFICFISRYAAGCP